MSAAFYAAAAIAILSTLMVVTRSHAIHALLYFIVSLFSTAVIMVILGAPFVAALEVIVYAGAIMVLFVFVVMILDLRPRPAARRSRLLEPRAWAGPVSLGFLLLLELGWVLATRSEGARAAATVGPAQVGAMLLGPFAIGVEIASMLLLAGLVGAYHLGRAGGRTEEP